MRALKTGKVKGQCVRSSGWDISDVLCKIDIWGQVTVIIFSNTHTHIHRTLTALPIPPDEDTPSYQ